MKVVFAFLPVLFFGLASAQTKIAIKAGVNMSTARVYQNEVKLDTKYNTGYGVAVLFKVPFDGPLHFSPSIGYNRRGYTYMPASGSITQYQHTIHYLDLLPALSLDFPAGESSLVLSAGPHFSVAMAGTEKTTADNLVTSSNMTFSTANHYGPVDVGLAGSIGYHFKKILVEAGFQLGLVNINNDVETDHRNIQNRMISLQVGYYFK